jgi:hypothetical protein
MPLELAERREIERWRNPALGELRRGLERAPALGQVERIEVARAPQRKRGGKSYDAKVAAAVIHLAVELNERPRRAIRDRWYHEGAAPGATTVLIDHIMGLMNGERLSPDRRQLWMREAGRTLDDGSVTLDELTQRLT